MSPRSIPRPLLLASPPHPKTAPELFLFVPEDQIALETRLRHEPFLANRLLLCSSQTTQNNRLFHPIPGLKMIHMINMKNPKSANSGEFRHKTGPFAPFSLPEPELNLVVLCPSELLGSTPSGSEGPARLGHIGDTLAPHCAWCSAGESPRCLRKIPSWAFPARIRPCP